MARRKIAKRADDYAQWYQDVIAEGQMAEHSMVRGCMIIKPWGFGIWERIQREMDDRIKATGHENAYFPLFVPKSLFDKEAEHVEGFAPECAVVTHGGDKELEEPLFVRPTSEAIICTTYGKWVESWRDLPIMINQWANVVRWEMRPRLFLRTMEFLWQEGHTAHETHDEAKAEVQTMLDVYAECAENVLAVPVVKGVKSESERFPGAENTYTIEAMMQDGRALQAGTSHDLGQVFSKAYGIEFQGRDGTMQHAWSTSWGVSTRLVGALIMTHGDDDGVVVPPKLAPIQLVIIPIYKGDEQAAEIKPDVEAMITSLRAAGVRVKADLREHLRPGPKFFEWEKKGVPLRVEYGMRDKEAGNVVLKRRDTGEKQIIPMADLASVAAPLLVTIQSDMLERARVRRDANTHVLDDYADFKSRVGDGGFFHMRWCGDSACETKVKEDTKATIRCLPHDSEPDPGPCAICGEAAEGVRAIFARAY